MKKKQFFYAFFFLFTFFIIFSFNKKKNIAQQICI
jgi:hypothetical protein